MAGRLLFHAFEQFHHQCNNDSEYHQHNGEQLKITHEVTLPSTRLPIGGYVNRKVSLPGEDQPPTVFWQTPAWFPTQHHHNRKKNTMQQESLRCFNQQRLFLFLKQMKGCDPIDTTYTLELTEAQYAALLDRAAELEIPLEDLLLQAIQNQIKEEEPCA